MNEDIVVAYNYDEFVGEKVDRWLNFDASPPVGEPAPDFPLTALDGETVHLSDVWRSATYTIVEFGSFT